MIFIKSLSTVKWEDVPDAIALLQLLLIWMNIIILMKEVLTGGLLYYTALGGTTKNGQWMKSNISLDIISAQI